MKQKISLILHSTRLYFQSGTMRTVSARIQALHVLQKCIKKYENDILHALYLDLGKSQAEGYMSEIAQVYEEIKSAKKWVKKYTKPKKVKTPLSHFGGTSTIHYEPYGVVLIIAPWNYPISLSLSPIVGAIAAGNCVVLKPSEYAPKSAEILERIIAESFDANCVSVICGDKDVASLLLQERFDYIFFTGSVAVGHLIMQEAAKYLTPITLELGGKNPCIIEDSTTIRTATKRIVWGKFLNAGQTCIAPDILFVNAAIKDEVIQNLKRNIAELYLDRRDHVPNLLDSSIQKEIMQSKDYGKIISLRHFERCRNLLQDVKEKGGEDTIICGGLTCEDSLKIAPTLLDLGKLEDILHNVGQSNNASVSNVHTTPSFSDTHNQSAFSPLTLKILQEEIFAPIMPIFVYDSLQACLQFIQTFEKPLALYIFSNDTQKQNYIIQNISFGGGCINDCIVHVANNHLPFGGVGNSGIGSYHGIHSARTFCRQKSIYYAPTLFDIPLRYPPFDKKFLGFKRLKILRWLFG